MPYLFFYPETVIYTSHVSDYLRPCILVTIRSYFSLYVMHPVELFMPLYYVLYAIYEATGHLSEGSFVRNVVVQIPKFDVKPNPNSDPNPSPNPNRNSNPNPTPNPNSNPKPSPNPNPMPVHLGKMTLWTSELLPIYDALLSFCRRH